MVRCCITFDNDLLLNWQVLVGVVSESCLAVGVVLESCLAVERLGPWWMTKIGTETDAHSSEVRYQTQDSCFTIVTTHVPLNIYFVEGAAELNCARSVIFCIS